jgi:hypothetical protein
LQGNLLENSFKCWETNLSVFSIKEVQEHTHDTDSIDGLYKIEYLQSSLDETDATVLSDDDNDIPIEKLEDECSVFGNATIIPPRKFRSDVKPKQTGSVKRKLKVRKFERMQYGFNNWLFFLISDSRSRGRS